MSFKKILTVFVIYILSSTCLWSQSSEPLDLSIDKSKIENMLVGSWYAYNFSVPGRMELGWYENNLKDAISISRKAVVLFYQMKARVCLMNTMVDVSIGK